MFQTRITALFGIEWPILAGGLQWLATPAYVAAAGRAGIIGFLTAASYADLGDLRNAIRRCSDLAEGKPFGVNISMLPKPAAGDRTAAVAALVIEEGVRFIETSGRNPEIYLPILQSGGAKVIHKVPTLKHALKAESIGVDAVSLVGAECGGHPGTEMVGTFVQAALAGRALAIPLVVGGGIGSGTQLVAALALGADGVVIGTRFLAADEIWAHGDYKRRLIEAEAGDTALIMESLRNSSRVLRNHTSELVEQLELDGTNLADLMPYIAGRIGRRAYETGDWSHGVLSVGQSVAFIDRAQPLAEIIRRLADEAVSALARLDKLMRAGG